MRSIYGKYINSWARKAVLLVLALVLACGLAAALAGAAGAADVRSLLREANNELRQAEKLMFAGQADEAIEKAQKVQEMVGQIKAADPANRQLSSLEKKLEKLVRDLEKRTGKNLGAGTATVKEGSSAPALPAAPTAPALAAKPAPERAPAPARSPARTKAEPAAAAPKSAPATSGKLPTDAQRYLTKVNNGLGAIDRFLADLAAPDYRGDKDQLVQRAENRIKEMASDLEAAKQAAAQRGLTSHPDFDEAQAKIAGAEKRVAEAKAGFQKATAETKAAGAEITAAAKALKAEYDRLKKKVFDKATGTPIYYNDLEPAKALLAAVEDFEKTDLAGLKDKLSAFGQKYGTAKEEIDKKADAAGYDDPYYKASYGYLKLNEGMANVAKTRTVMAADLLKKAQERQGRVKGAHDFYRLVLAQEVKNWLSLAQAFDPGSQEVKSALESFEKWRAEDLQAFNQKVDKVTWPSHAPNAPSDAARMAQVAMDWFKATPGWGQPDPRAKDKRPKDILAVVVTGPWSVQARNIAGQPIMYGLPVRVAVQVQGDKDLNVARVFHLTLRTMEKAGVKAAPPFDHATVGNSYFIRPAAIK